MPALVIVRHSIPVVDATAPSTAWALSPEGEREAGALAAMLGAVKARIVQTSPERKAGETASIIAARHGVSTSVDDRLREHERASAGFLPRHVFDARVERLMRMPSDLVFGDETADAVFLRFAEAVACACAAAAGADLLMVSHGTAMSIYLGRLLGIDPVAFWRSLTAPMAVVIADHGMEIVLPPGAASPTLR
jgi:2,3-bisphosphoglycerate-dependent phosphoglycerate mutase